MPHCTPRNGPGATAGPTPHKRPRRHGLPAAVFVLVVAVPTFDRIAGAARRAAVVAIPLKHDYSHDLENMLAHCDAAAGLIVPTFEKSIRISVGAPAEMREFWRVFDLMPGHPMSM